MDAAPADVVFIIESLQHPLFVRDGDNLRRSITVSLERALLGFVEQLLHLDGHSVAVVRTEPTYPGMLVDVDDESNHVVVVDVACLLAIYSVPPW